MSHLLAARTLFLDYPFHHELLLLSGEVDIERPGMFLYHSLIVSHHTGVCGTIVRNGNNQAVGMIMGCIAQEYAGVVSKFIAVQSLTKIFFSNREDITSKPTFETSYMSCTKNWRLILLAGGIHFTTARYFYSSIVNFDRRRNNKPRNIG